MSFLTAEWRKLIIANYVVEQCLLEPYIPAGTELDFWEGKCYLSLVGFMFINTKLLGIKIPFHSNFEEVNLRFYVKRFEEGEWKRGVVFIKEIVPKRALTFVANTVYNENYETLPMGHFWEHNRDHLKVEYSWKKGGQWNQISVDAEPVSIPQKKNTESEFITEHYWGYAKVNDETSNEYEVKHPRWQTYPVKSHEIDVNFAATYGEAFSFLGDKNPSSIFLAEGSEISVENKQRIGDRYE